MDTTAAVIISILIMGTSADNSPKPVGYEPTRPTHGLVQANKSDTSKLQQTRKRIELTNNWLKNDQLKRKQLARQRLTKNTIRITRATNHACDADWQQT